MSEPSRFEYSHEGLSLVGRLALPAGPGPHPAVLVMHDALGLGELVKRRARILAEAGYVALATDMYGTGETSGDPAKHGALFGALQEQPQRLRDRVLAGYEALRALPQVDTKRIGAIGFCFGGSTVLTMARGGMDVRGVVSFHGALDTVAPAQPGAVKAKVLACHGADDPMVTPEHVVAFEDEMRKAGADWQVIAYGGTVHSFTNPDAGKTVTIPGVAYNERTDKRSWQAMRNFFDEAFA